MEPERGLSYLGFASRSERRDVEAPPGERTKNPRLRPVRIFIPAELAPHPLERGLNPIRFS